MQRSMYWSSSKREAITSRAVTSWIAALGTEVFERAVEMVEEMALNERVVSLPPTATLDIPYAGDRRVPERIYPLEWQHCLI